MKVIALIVVLLALLAATGALHVDFYAWHSDSSPAHELRTMYEVEQNSDLDEATAALYKLVDATPRDHRGVTRIRQQLSALVARFAAAASTLRQRTLEVDVKSRLGRQFREGFLRVVAQQQWIVSTFGDEIARNRPTWAAVRRFNARSQALARRWQAQLDETSARIDADERPGVQPALDTP